jgi:hypothetical protein
LLLSKDLRQSGLNFDSIGLTDTHVGVNQSVLLIACQKLTIAEELK